MDTRLSNQLGLRLGAALVLGAFYFLSAPQNHGTALDSYGFAHWISDQPISAVPELRLFLWIAAAQIVYDAVSLFAADPDPFVIFGILNAFQTAAAVVLLERILSKRFRLASATAWAGAFAFAFSYGVWRYSAELEVYAFTAFVSLALTYAAFSLDRESDAASPMRTPWLAVFGGLATLSYQPLGVLAGFAIPFYLFLTLPLRRVAVYYVVSGFVVAAGLAFSSILAAAAAESTNQFVFDTDGKLPSIPSLADLAQSAVGLAHNVFAINWSFAFGPTRAIYEQYAGGWYEVFLYPAGFAHPSYLIFLVTVPAIVLLSIYAFFTAFRTPQTRTFDAKEACLAVWLAGNAAVVLSIDPTSLEPWIPSLAPIFILVSVRVISPMFDLGRKWVIILLLPVLFIHNGLAGLGVIFAGEHDVRPTKSVTILGVATKADLLIVGYDWSFHRYLLYASDAPSLLLSATQSADANAMIVQTLNSGGRVILFEDVLAEPYNEPWRDVRAAPEFEQVVGKFLNAGEWIPLNGLGAALIVSKTEG